MPYTIEQFLEIRAAAFSGFSPDGSKVLVNSNLTGTGQLYRIPRTGGELHRVTNYDEGVAGRYLPTTDEIVFRKDEGGNEHHQIYRARDDGSGVVALTGDPDHIHMLDAVARDGTTLMFTSNRRNGVDFDVYLHDLATGAERCIFDMGGWCQGAGFSPDGSTLAVTRATDRSFDNDLYLIDAGSGDVVHVCPHEEEAVVGAPSWLPDGSSFFFATDIDRDFIAIGRYDVEQRAWDRVIERDWDLGCGIDWPGRQLRVTTNEEAYSTIELFDPRSLELRSEVSLPGRGIAGTTFSHDGRYLGLTFISPTEPGDAWRYDIETEALSRLTTSPNPVPDSEFVTPQLHRFRSFDGESIPVFLYRPRDARGDVPVVAWIHGGPESQYVPGFSAVIQYFVHRGYAVAAPNVRGSTGYGQRYHRLDDKRKRLDSVRDLAAMHAWIDETPGLDARRAALMGGSYGGYMVLAGLAFQPDLWAAGVDIVGISSFITFLENTAPWRRKIREREYGSIEADHDFLVEASPLTHVDRIRAPLFIIHGTNDPRVPMSEARQIHAALKTKGIATELLVYDDEGHGLAKLKNRLDAYPKAAAFLDRVLR